MNHSRHQGFTLVNMLAAIAIIVILSISGTIAYRNFGKAGRDTARIAGIERVKKMLELYYEDNKHYPPAGSSYKRFWDYEAPHPTCDGANYTGTEGGVNNQGLRFDNSSSGVYGIPEVIFDQYGEKYAAEGFKDPLGDDNEIHNCRYVIPMTSQGINGDSLGPEWDWYCPSRRGGNDCPHPDTFREIQKYYIHCTLETNFEAGASDGGSNCPGGEYIYEVFAPNRWIVIDNAPAPS